MKKQFLKNKKSQIQFGESFGVLIIVYLLVVLGFSFYNSYLNDKNEESQKENQKFLNNERFHYVKNLELLKTSNRNIIKTTYDYDNLKVFKKYSESQIGKKKLDETIGFGIIEIKLLNFNNGLNESFLIYNKSINKNKIKNIKKRDILIPIENVRNGVTRIGIMTFKFYELY